MQQESAGEVVWSCLIEVGLFFWISIDNDCQYPLTFIFYSNEIFALRKEHIDAATKV